MRFFAASLVATFAVNALPFGFAYAQEAVLPMAATTNLTSPPLVVLEDGSTLVTVHAPAKPATIPTSAAIALLVQNTETSGKAALSINYEQLTSNIAMQAAADNAVTQRIVIEKVVPSENNDAIVVTATPARERRAIEAVAKQQSTATAKDMNQRTFSASVEGRMISLSNSASNITGVFMNADQWWRAFARNARSLMGVKRDRESPQEFAARYSDPLNAPGASPRCNYRTGYCERRYTRSEQLRR